jgi:hypothetical protein
MTSNRNSTVFLAGFLFSLLLVSSGFGSQDLQSDLNDYFTKIDAAFEKISEAGAVRSTSLRSAERLFVREMRKNQAYTMFFRTNSKGVIISEVVRGEKAERPMRSVADQKWYRTVSAQREAYYTLVKDSERGRYYLLWARPILKSGDRFVGAVAAKIDLWDSFYEFSNSVYVPFLVKLGRKSLFSHKWKNSLIGGEKSITVPGVDRISVIYIQEKQSAPAAAVQKDTVKEPSAVTAPVEKVKESPEPAKKKGGSGTLIILLIVLFAVIAIASLMLISWMKRRTFLKRLEEDDDPLL